jgi:hypothetical protein
MSMDKAYAMRGGLETEADNDGEDDERVGHWYERCNEGVDDELQRLRRG